VNVGATSLARFPLHARRARRAIAATLGGIFALGLAVPPPAHAGPFPTLLFLPASGRDVASAVLQRARSLLVERLGRPDRFRVIDLDRPPTPLPRPPREAAGLAMQMGADLMVALDVSHVAGQTTFDLSCWVVTTGAPVCHVREVTSAGPEVLPHLAEWVALRLMRELGEDRTLGAVRAERAASGRRAGSRAFGAGVRAGVIVPMRSPADETTALSSLGLLFTANAGPVLVDFGADYAMGTGGSHLGGLGLGMLVPLGRDGALPYLGTALWWVDQRLGGRGARGLQLRPTLGVSWMRSDGIRVRAEAGYFVDLFRELEEDRLIPGSGEPRVAHGFISGVGATF
jgi:hypothetical protein